MVDAQTQYSPPTVLPSDSSSRTPTTATQIADLQIVEQESESSQSDSSEAAIVEAATRQSPSVSDPNEMSAAQTGTIATSASTASLPIDKPEPEIAKREPLQRKPSQSYKRNHSTAEEVANPSTVSSDHDASIPPITSKEERRKSSTPSSAKKMRPESEPARILPLDYSLCAPRDLVLLISSMLMDLIRYNDTIPLRDGHLTRFHSRAPPGISVTDYLQRLTTHATLPPPILLSMVYYIDKLCALYPAFTISSLTVHRFLITAATVASKGLSDSFWTNKTYARVGGVSLRELALLEQEFLWRIVPQPEVLVDYYKSLVNRTAGYELESEQAAAGRAAHQHQTGLARDAG
ncbi:Pho80p cyclin [Lithohypha guttulata]|uniref:Pho80p cyclin n=1 Tax=Lithohypha guttulata TaxID=1690604 RepID=A0AAN7T1R0_9EURO|nr:Pho80p cyclin [Lithohypha guttulata]KAK5087755.1 Pho80p cyclin [Lithohypha guttulata]